MDQTLIYVAVHLLVLLYVPTDAFPEITDDLDSYYNLRQIYDDLFSDFPTTEKRVAPDYLQDWSKSETNRINDNTLFNLYRRGGAWNNGGFGSSGRWAGNSRIVPYVTYDNGINYKSNTSPSSWYGRGWYRVLSQARQPGYRSQRRIRNSLDLY